MFEREKDEIVKWVSDLKSVGLLEHTGGSVAFFADDCMIITPTGASRSLWTIRPEDAVVVDRLGETVERGAYLAPAATPLFLNIKETFPLARAIVHTHSEWSLVFAAMGITPPRSINSYDRLGEVPLIDCDDAAIKAAFRAEPWEVRVPKAMVDRPDVVAVQIEVAGLVRRKLGHRAGELESRALGFLLRRHGAVTISASLSQAVEGLAIMEANARTAFRARCYQGSHAL